MPSIYHLHPTPSQPDLGIITPPASPRRAFVSPHATPTEADMAGTTCNCGHQMFDGRGCCPACFQRQQKRHYRLSGRVSEHPMSPSTPPPSQSASPRESLERGRPVAMPQMMDGVRRQSAAAAAINSAFTSQEEHENDHEPADILPSRLYRTPRRASSRGASAVQPERTATIRHSEDHLGHIVGHLARPTTPTKGTSGLGLRDYSPMAASFARMNRREIRSEAAVDERRLSQRGSLELAARMFDGPA